MPSLSINLLRSVSGVGAATVRNVIDAGYRTLEDLEGITLDQLTAIPGVGTVTAEGILEFLENVPADDPVQAYRHAAKRKNIPPAGLAAHGQVEEVPGTRYSYDPHLPPVLRFDFTGDEDRLPELLQIAQQRALTDEEADLLAEALRNHQPWLEWTGKREKRSFKVDPVALHIHERISTEAILKLARRQPLQRRLFADPELEYREAVKFYRHDVDWTNRLILGDSLVVMNSLARREDLAGKVQMIYVDPPYGIKFASNFQPFVHDRAVKDRDQDLTREPEQIKAYRDTWTLGMHSYLTYLRDRLRVARELLATSGSIFVQINDENLHLVRCLLDEVFGTENFVSVIAFKKTSGFSSARLDNVLDFIIWYARDLESMKFNSLLVKKDPDEQIGVFYDHIEFADGRRRRLTTTEATAQNLPEGAKVFQGSVLYSEGATATGGFPIHFEGDVYRPPSNAHWKTNEEGMTRLFQASRLYLKGRTLRYVRYFDDYPFYPLNNIWSDTSFGGFVGDQRKIYVVQTYTKVIERCMLMTTDPGDLVLDPTCGSGTTANVAEGWGRRWITIDTSRVAIALARQRLLTAKFDYYKLADSKKGVSAGFDYKTAPHITLRSIAQNQALDPIFEKWEPILGKKLARLNNTLGDVTAELRTRLQTNLVTKERQEGKRAITEADERRWLLPDDRWEHWEVPYDTDPDWPESLQKALHEYRTAWQQKMREVNETIAASAPQETLYDQPEVVPGVVRVSGPFTVEGVQPDEESLDLDTLIGGEPEELPTFSGNGAAEEPANAEAYLEKMIQLLRQDGVRFPDNKILNFDWLDPLSHSSLHAEGEWGNGDIPRRVAVSFGPQYGPITAKQVEEALRDAYRRGYDDLVFAGFTIDGAAQAAIQEDPNPEVRCHLAHIRPDVNMGDLLKDTPSSQLFTVFGLPRVELEQTDDGEWVAEMQGVDIYDPVNNTIRATKAEKVAAWFLDADYDGRTFCVSQAFFPDRSAWDKLAKALKTIVDPQRFAAFSGTRSLPFLAGEHNRIAVKVIDPRGNEVMRVRNLDEEFTYA